MVEMRNDLKLKGLEAWLAQNRTAWHWALNSKSESGCENEVVQPSDMGKTQVKPWSK